MKAAAYRHPSPEFLTDLSQRRERLYTVLGDDICIVQSAPDNTASLYSRVPYKQDADFFYLTGLHEPGCVGIFSPKSKERFKLFLPPVDKTSELWNGPMTPPEQGAAAFGADACYPLSELKNHLKEMVPLATAVYLNLRTELGADSELRSAFRFARVENNGLELRHHRYLLGNLRMRKSPWEIANLRRAGLIGSQMHIAAMKAKGQTEYELQAVLEAEARAQGSLWMGYTSIVASGSNACCLHYNVNNCPVESQDLVLIDAGCEWENVTSDITRTWPSSGVFTAPQRKIYDLVLKAQMAALAVIKPGATLKNVEDTATETLVEGLLSLGLLTGNAKDIIEKKEHKELYPHTIGHWLGGDVHDAGHYLRLGSEVPFEPGMCFTVEPGIYVQTHLETGGEFRGIGVRIEDNIVVTTQGHENLTPCPKVPEDLERTILGARAK